MDSLEIIRKEAIEICKEAVDLDAKEKFIEAKDKYMEAVGKFKYLLKIDRNEANRSVYQERSIDYNSRAKELDIIISKQINIRDDKLKRLTSFDEKKKIAMNLARLAVEYDNAGKLEQAIKAYEEVADQLKSLCKEEQFEKMKTNYKKKSNDYAQHAKELKKLLEVKPSPEEDNSLPNLKKRVLQIAQKAVECDEALNYNDAITYYIKAAEMLNSISKKDPEETNRTEFKKKGLEYCHRVIELKKLIGRMSCGAACLGSGNKFINY